MVVGNGLYEAAKKIFDSKLHLLYLNEDEQTVFEFIMGSKAKFDSNLYDPKKLFKQKSLNGCCYLTKIYSSRILCLI
jgi:hypothetical protein